MKTHIDLQPPMTPAPGMQRRSSSGLDRPKGASPANGSVDEARLDRACAEFEALFIQQLFASMRASIPKSGLIDGGTAEEIYTGMLDQQTAQDLALQGGMGLSARIKAQILQRLQKGEANRVDGLAHRPPATTIKHD